MPQNSHQIKWGWPATVLAIGLWLSHTISAPSALAAGTPSEPARQAVTGITLTARGGFDGYYKQDQWTPIRVTIANDGPEVNGTLQAKVPHNNSETLYTRPVELPTQSRREFFFYVPPEGYLSSNSLKIDLVAGNRILASVNVRLTQVAPADYLYGVLASAPSAFNVLADIDPDNGQSHVAQLDPADLPTLLAGWKALDVLIISGVDTGGLTTQQRQALEDWVLAGGRLIVAGGPEWQKTSAGIGALLPLSPSGIQSVADLRPLGVFAGAAAPGGPALAAVGQLAPDAISLVKTEDVPTVVYRQPGYGQVAFIAFDPALAPLKGWDGLSGIFRGLLTMSPDRPNWANGFFNWSSANEAARAVPGLAVPSVWQVCGFLAVYVIAVGPLNFLILRRFKRRMWAWLTIPGVVLLFSLAAYLTGYGMRGSQAILHRLTVVEVWPKTERARAQQIVGLFSPQRTTHQVTFEPGILARPIPYSGGVPTLSTVVVEQTDRTRLPAVRTEIGAVETFIAQGQAPAPRFDADLTLRLSSTAAAGPGVLAGTVTNQSDLRFTDAVLLVPGSFQRLASIEPGQTMNITGLVLSASQAAPARTNTFSSPTISRFGRIPPPYGGGDTTFSDILGAAYPTNQEQYRRNMLLSAILDQYGGGTRGHGVYLAGWTATSPLGARVSAPYRTLDMSLYLVALPYTLDAGQGDLVLPPGLLTWSALDLNQVNYTPYDTYLDPGGEMGFEFAPGLPMPIKSVKALTLHLVGNGQSGRANPIRFQLYDFTENTWEDRPDVVWGDTPIPAPERFVGPQTNVLVRIKNTSGMSINIKQADLTLEAER